MVKKIGYSSVSPNDGCSYYRTSFVFPYIQSTNLEFLDLTGIPYYQTYKFAGLHTLIIQRPATQNDVDYISCMRNMGIRVIGDYDDDLLTVPIHNLAHEQCEKNKSTLLQCLELLDEIWVSTEAIKNKFSLYNDNIHVIPNAHNDYIQPIGKKKPFDKEGKRIAYRGSQSVEVDLYRHLNDLVSVIEENPDWEFRFIGSRFPYLESLTGGNHTFTNSMSALDFYYNLSQYNPNIMFYPLMDIEFNRSKSNCSFLEATYAGAAFVGNTDLPEFDIPTMLNVNIGLKKAIEDLISHPQAANELNEMSWRYIKQNLLLSHINELRIGRLNG